MNIRALFASAFILLSGLAAAFDAAPAQTDPRATQAFARLDPWLRSVVYLRITCKAGDDPYVGTGILVRDTGEVLTAAHVGSECLNVTTAKVGRLQSLYTAPGEELTATFQKRIADSRTSPTKDQVQDAEFQDLALWKIDNMANSGLVAARLATDFPSPGEPIEIVGFSNLPYRHGIVGTNGVNAGPGLTRFRTALISVGASDRDVPYRLHYPGFTLGGASGGPVFNAQGQLLGIHSTRTAEKVRESLVVGCTIGSLKNCVPVMVPGRNKSQVRSTVGIDVLKLKAMLDNYSWATSIFAIPAGWLP
jgi:S1-C subfamily serine protease